MDSLLLVQKCRRAFHGVPRILKGSCFTHLMKEEAKEWDPCAQYDEDYHINVKARFFPQGV